MTKEDLVAIVREKHGGASFEDEAAAAELSRLLPVLLPLLVRFDLTLGYKQAKPATAQQGPSPLKDVRKLLARLPDDDLAAMKEILSQVAGGSSLDSAIRVRASKLAPATVAADSNASRDGLADPEAESNSALAAVRSDLASSTRRCDSLLRRARSLVSVAKSERSRRRDAELIVKKSHRVIRRHRDGMGELRRRLAKSLSERDRFNSYFTAQMNVAGQFKVKLAREEARANFADLNAEQIRAELDRCQRRQGRARDSLLPFGLKEWIRSGFLRH